jgi:hypothetical protein
MLSQLQYIVAKVIFFAGEGSVWTVTFSYRPRSGDLV